MGEITGIDLMHANLPAHVDIANARLPEAYEAARQALAKCERIDECKSWSDRMAALASYARQVEDETLLKAAMRIHGRAIRRVGELMAEIEPAKNQHDAAARAGRAYVDALTCSGASRTEAARAAGLSDHQRVQALRVANIPAAEFEAAIESDMGASDSTPPASDTSPARNAVPSCGAGSSGPVPGPSCRRAILPLPLAMHATPLLTADLYQCDCPGGEDHTVYLVFDRRWRALCTHGCKEGDILQGFGMAPDALEPPPLVYPAYPYHAPDGTLLFEVVRRPHVPNGWDRFFIREHAARFESSLVYRLPEMLAAPLEVPVYWTEGEKDAEALRAHGLVAVTTSDGPVPYDPRKVVQWFEGHQVVLLPDNDEAGQLYAAKIEESLCGIASSVTRLQLPAGVKDVSEWLAGGRRLQDLLGRPAA